MKNVPVADPRKSGMWNRLKVIAEVVKGGLKNPSFLFTSAVTLGSTVGPELYEHYLGEDTTFEERLLRLEELQQIKQDMNEVIEAGYGEEMFTEKELEWFDSMLLPEERASKKPKERSNFGGNNYFEDTDELISFLM